MKKSTDIEERRLNERIERVRRTFMKTCVSMHSLLETRNPEEPIILFMHVLAWSLIENKVGVDKVENYIEMLRVIHEKSVKEVERLRKEGIV